MLWNWPRWKVLSLFVVFVGKNIFIFYVKIWRKKSTNLTSDFADFPPFGQNDRFMSDIGGPVSSIILILELSYYMQNSWAFDALLNGAIPRVPCTAVFLRSRVQNILHFLTTFRDDIWIGSHFYNIDPRIKLLYAKFMSIWCPTHWSHPQSPVHGRFLTFAGSK